MGKKNIEQVAKSTFFFEVDGKAVEAENVFDSQKREILEFLLNLLVVLFDFSIFLEPRSTFKGKKHDFLIKEAVAGRIKGVLVRLTLKCERMFLRSSFVSDFVNSLRQVANWPITSAEVSKSWNSKTFTFC